MNQQDFFTVFLLVATMVLWGSTPLFEKLGLRDVEPLAGLLVRSLAVTLVLVIVFFSTGRMHEVTTMSLKNILLFSVSGIMAGLVAMWTYYYVLKSGNLSKIVPIAAAYPLITAILSAFILKEGLSFQRIVGIILTIVGIILVKKS